MNLTELLAKLDTPIVIRPTRRMTQGEIETYLDKAADILRGNADPRQSIYGFNKSGPEYMVLPAAKKRCFLAVSKRVETLRDTRVTHRCDRPLPMRGIGRRRG